MTKDTPPGWEYSVAVFHGLNLSAFLVIFFAYTWMYKRIKASTKASRGKSKNEMTAARMMMLIVLTDFCCWFPVNVMGMLHLHIKQLTLSCVPYLIYSANTWILFCYHGPYSLEYSTVNIVNLQTIF